MIQLQHTQAMGMDELEVVGKPSLEFLPQLPDAESSLSDVDVVEHDNGPWCQFGEPGLEIMPNCLICVQTIDVQEVDALI